MIEGSRVQFPTGALPGTVPYVNSAFHSSEVGKSSTSLLAGFKAGRVHLCRVAGNTVWSNMAGDVPSCEMHGFPMNSYRHL